MARRTTFVCSGGGAKAAAHLGAAGVLAERGVVPVHYVGTSLGAVVAVLLAAGQSPEVILEAMRRVSTRGVKTHPLAVATGLHLPGLLQLGPYRKALRALLPVRHFGELPTPCTVTAVDLDSGSPVVFGTGGEDAPIEDALLASTALPVYFPPVLLGGRRLADGGLRAVVPLDEALLQAPEQVIAVQVGPRFDEVPREPDRLPPLVRAHSEAEGILMATCAELQRELWMRRGDRPPLLYVTPRTERFATFRTGDMPQYFAEGARAMREALAQEPAFAIG
jgi:predicted acylesterase/phospholipase RssA